MKYVWTIAVLVFPAFTAWAENPFDFPDLPQLSEKLKLPDPIRQSGVTRIDIEGLDPTKLFNVRTVLDPRFEQFRAQAAAPSRADDAAFILTELLQKDGYAEAKVAWKIPSANRIVLTVEEGTRLALGKVTVEGADPEIAGKLARLYSSIPERDRPLGLGPPPFRADDVEKGLTLVRQELNAIGYWLAEVKQGPVVFRDRKADVTVLVKQGPLHKIGPPVVTGDKGADDVVREIAKGYEGRPATTKHINAMRKAVSDAVSSRGYARAEIRMGWHTENALFHPDFSIVTGERMKLRDVKVHGLEKTNSERVLVRLRDMQGNWYDEKEVHKRLSVMLATGAFSSARVETDDVNAHTLDATLHLEEGKAKEISTAFGVDSYYGPVARVVYSDRNWLGQLYGLNAGFEASARGLFGELKVADPWINGSDFAGSARAFLLLFDREGYFKYESGFEGGLDWKPTDKYKLELRATLSAAKVEGDGLPNSELGMELYSNPRLRLTQKLDFRDSPVLPKEGWHIESPFEIGSAAGSSIIPYVSQGLSAGWYHPVGRRWGIGLGGDLGLLVPLGENSDFPIDMRYFNGGARSVRSFPERELGPQADGFSTGGESMWVANFELTRDITEALKLVTFLDAGGLGEKADDLLSSKVNFAAGLGVRFDLPIGPVRVEYGYNLTRDEGEPAGTLQFAIGTAF